MTKFSRILMAIFVLRIFCNPAAAEQPSAPEAKSLRERALTELRRALDEESKWVKVHAAESLLGIGEFDQVAASFAEELKQRGSEPQYRIGIWRVLARAVADEAQRAHYVRQILDVALTDGSPDRVHAVEALAKLRYQLTDTERARIKRFAATSSEAEQPNYLWLLAISGKAADRQALVELLRSTKVETRAVAAYAMRHLSKELSESEVDQLAQAATAEPASGMSVYLIGAAYVTATDHADAAKRFTALVKNLASDAVTARCEALNAIAARGNVADLSQVAASLDDREADVRVSAATAVLRLSPL
jgi:hypothetical protein